MKAFLKFLSVMVMILFMAMLLSPDVLDVSGVCYAAAPLGFAPLFSGCGIENMAGWQNRLAFIPECHVKTIPLLPKDIVKDEDLVTASGAFEFKDAEGKPMYIYATDKTVKYTAENQGETDGQSFKLSGEFFYPGTAAKAAAFARKVNNTPGYLILISPEGEQFLVGQPGLPCTIKPSFDGGQARADRRGFKFTYEADSYTPLIKLGTPIDFEALLDESGNESGEG